MKIAFVSEAAPGWIGGVQTLLRNIFELLIDRLNQQVLFISPLGQQSLPDAFREHDFQKHFVPSLPVPFYTGLRLAPRLDSEGLRLLKAFKPDVVHLVDPWFLCRRAGKWASSRGIPVVASFHSDISAMAAYYIKGFPKGLAWHICRSAYRHATITLAPTRAIREMLESRGFHRVARWGRGVDVDVFNPRKRDPSLRMRLLGKTKTHIGLYVGRVSWDKEVPFILESLMPLRFLKMVVVGDGPALPKLRARFEPQGVVFTGFLTGEDLARHYASADIMVFASQIDTYGQVLNEGLASGLPIVAAENAVAAEVLAEAGAENIVPRGDAFHLRQRVEMVISDPQIKVSLHKIGRQIALRRTWIHAAEELMSHYKTALSALPAIRRSDPVNGKTACRFPLILG